MTHKFIGEILKEICSLSDDIFDEALEIQREKGGRIGEILIQKGAIGEGDLLKARGIQFGIPLWPTIATEDI
ncbi:MAG: type II secretion system protein GspE, partial [Deltaproteobacteria bacterium]